MKRIVLCGSKKFKDEVLRLGEVLQNRGYEAIVPKEFLVEMDKREHSMIHFNEITNEKTDAVLIVNENKGEIENYIGPNSFAEVAMGFYFGKKVYLKNDIYIPYKDELEGWGVIPLKGEIDKIFKNIN